jgi:hypothetical protein
MRPIRSEASANSALRQNALRSAYVARRASDEAVRPIFLPDSRTVAQRAADRQQLKGILASREVAEMLTPGAAARIAAAFAKARGGAA